MPQTEQSKRKSNRWVAMGLLVTGLLILAAFPALSARHDKYETIEATAMGTGTQMGQNAGISVEIYDFSTPEERQILVDAFNKGQNQGLVNALTKMRAVGHISVTGTIGYDLAFVRMIPTPTGRKIRFVTNRMLRFGEVWADSQSTAFNLTGGEFDINDTDKARARERSIRSANWRLTSRANCRSSSRKILGIWWTCSTGKGRQERTDAIDSASPHRQTEVKEIRTLKERHS